jgi:site-specific recombinase XerD
VGQTQYRQDVRTDDGREHLAALQGLRRMIGYPELTPHDLRHGVAMEVLEQHHDLEQVRALLGHRRIDTTQIYASIRPAQLKRVVGFYEEKASRMLSQ